MPQYKTQRIDLPGQQYPYYLQVETNLKCQTDVQTLSGKSTLSISVCIGKKTLPLMYNASHSISFSGPGGALLMDKGSKYLILIDEFGSPKTTTYVFEEHGTNFWINRAYSQKLTWTAFDNLKHIFSMRNDDETDHTWHFVEDPVEGNRIVEQRGILLYTHKLEDNTSFELETLDLTTLTDYSFFIDAGHFWVDEPNGSRKHLKLNKNIAR